MSKRARKKKIKSEAERRGDKTPSLELVSKALKTKDDNVYWDVLVTMHFRASSDDFHQAVELSQSPFANRRTLGCDILGQLGIPKRIRSKYVQGILSKILDSDKDQWVLRSAAIAYGHHPGNVGLNSLLKRQRDSRTPVRDGVAFGLSGNDDPRAIKALIRLSRDKNSHVRNWATFGLGSQTDKNTPAIRSALRARLKERGTELKDEIRGEAQVGLAIRKDDSARKSVLSDLRRTKIDWFYPLTWEAAELYGIPTNRS